MDTYTNESGNSPAFDARDSLDATSSSEDVVRMRTSFENSSYGGEAPCNVVTEGNEVDAARCVQPSDEAATGENAPYSDRPCAKHYGEAQDSSESNRSFVDKLHDMLDERNQRSDIDPSLVDPCDPYPDTELDESQCATHNSCLGKRGEDAAARYLESHGYEILERNWKCCAGEADIIALDEDDLVFIEVKTRSNIKLGFPEEAVDARKRNRYEKIAALYLRDFDRCDFPVRFDVIGILVTQRDRAMLRHHVNAFAQAC